MNLFEKNKMMIHQKLSHSVGGLALEIVSDLLLV